MESNNKQNKGSAIYRTYPFNNSNRQVLIGSISSQGIVFKFPDGSLGTVMGLQHGTINFNHGSPIIF
jgi:hypothetical protein